MFASTVRMAVDGHEAVAGPEVGARGRTVVDDGLDDDARLELLDLGAEVAASAGKLPDGLLAFARRGGAHLPVLGVSRGDEKKRCKREMGKSNGHFLGAGSLADGQSSLLWPRS